MAGGEDEDPTHTVDDEPRRRMHARHLVFGGLALLAVGAVVHAAGGRVIGPMLVVIGVFIMMFGAFGWVLERLGWDVDDPSGSTRIHDISRLPTRIRKR